MSHKHEQLLQTIFHDPISANIHWREVESLLNHVGADVESLSGARVRVRLNGAEGILHRPHHGNTLDKSAVRAPARVPCSRADDAVAVRGGARIAALSGRGCLRAIAIGAKATTSAGRTKPETKEGAPLPGRPPCDQLSINSAALLRRLRGRQPRGPGPAATSSTRASSPISRASMTLRRLRQREDHVDSLVQRGMAVVEILVLAAVRTRLAARRCPCWRRAASVQASVKVAAMNCVYGGTITGTPRIGCRKSGTGSSGSRGSELMSPTTISFRSVGAAAVAVSDELGTPARTGRSWNTDLIHPARAPRGGC